MTYVIDLQRLWEGAAKTSAKDDTSLLEPYKNVVSVIMVAQVEETKLLQSIQSVLAQQFVREVIIVNAEASSEVEKSLMKFASLHPKCYIVNGQRGMGLASAYNLGTQYASGQYLLFLDSRCLLTKNAIVKLLATGVRKPMPWIIGMKGFIQPQAVPMGVKPNLWAKLKQKIKNKINVLWYGVENNKMHSPLEVSLPGGGFHATSLAPQCLFISTQTFLDLKGMDRKCFHSTFHIDLCLKVHLAGGGVYQAKDLYLVNNQIPPVTFGKTFSQQWQAFKGMHHFYKKYVSNRTNIFWSSVLYCGLVLRFLGNLSLSLFSFRLPRTTKVEALEKQRCLT